MEEYCPIEISQKVIDMKISKNNLRKLSFSDHIIELMILDIKSKTLSIKITGAYFKINDQVKKLGRGNILISAWKDMTISMYDARDLKWIRLDDKTNYDVLKEICEAEFNDTVFLRGFGKNTGQWIQYEIISPELDVNFTD